MQKLALKLASISLILTLLATPFQAFAAYNSMLAPTDFTPQTYQPPKYDSFDHDYYYPPPLPDEEPDLPSFADFNIYTDQRGLPDTQSGTTATVFTFDASASTDSESNNSRLEVRWDFENDNVLDSYFSRTKRITHVFPKPGVYKVKLEVLDGGGNISRAYKTVTIVQDTVPFAHFSVTPATGTASTIFRFNTSTSGDDQYVANTLQYRFDWNGDGKWDTKFENKNIWNHRFENLGNHRVVMEVKDPGNQRSQANLDISTSGNIAPTANFTIREIVGTAGSTFEFNAAASFDAETSHNRLRYRWDFNYNGPNDIIYDTAYAYTDRYNGRYNLPGHKVVRLEVTDEDGATDYAYASIDVSWESVMQRFARVIS